MMPAPDPATDPVVRRSIGDVAPHSDFLTAARAVCDHLLTASALSLWLVTRTAGDDCVLLTASDREPGAERAMRGGDVLTWSDGLCARMVDGSGPRVAPSVAAVPAYAMAPLRAQHQLGAYLGVPLVGPDGELFGTLCGISRHPVSAGLHALLPLVELQARLLSGLLAGEVTATRTARSAALATVGAGQQVLDAPTWEQLLDDEERRCAPLAVPASVVALEPHALPPSRTQDVVRALLERVRPGGVVARTGRTSYALLLTETPEVVAEITASALVLRLQEVGVAATCGVASRGRGADLRRAWRRAEAARRRDVGQAPLLDAG